MEILLFFKSKFGGHLKLYSLVGWLQYEFLIEEFKQRHKQFDTSQAVNDTVSDLRKDLQSMEDDREVLIRRIERIQRKVSEHACFPITGLIIVSH